MSPRATASRRRRERAATFGTRSAHARGRATGHRAWRLRFEEPDGRSQGNVREPTCATIPCVIVCGRCGKENEEGRETCARCGSPLDTVPAATAPEEGPSHFCHWHPRTATDLSCGRCGKFVCTKCVRLGPAGPRCKECARSGVSLRPAGIAYEAKVRLGRLLSFSPWLTVIVAISLIGTIGGWIRGCAARHEPPPVTLPSE